MTDLKVDVGRLIKFVAMVKAAVCVYIVDFEFCGNDFVRTNFLS